MDWLIHCVHPDFFYVHHMEDHPQLCMLIEAADIDIDSKSVRAPDEPLFHGQFVHPQGKGMETINECFGVNVAEDIDGFVLGSGGAGQATTVPFARLKNRVNFESTSPILSDCCVDDGVDRHVGLVKRKNHWQQCRLRLLSAPAGAIAVGARQDERHVFCAMIAIAMLGARAASLSRIAARRCIELRRPGCALV